MKKLLTLGILALAFISNAVFSQDCSRIDRIYIEYSMTKAKLDNLISFPDEEIAGAEAGYWQREVESQAKRLQASIDYLTKCVLHQAIERKMPLMAVIQEMRNTAEANEE